MARDLLFLCHRIPYPPEKGEKIRAWHMFERLAQDWRIHLGCFLDDPADRAHVPHLRALCADIACIEIDPRRAKLRALLRARPGQPLSLGYFADRRLRRWVEGKLAGGAMAAAFVYCSAMAPYVMQADGLRRVLDMVDVDSEKFAAYAAEARFPARAVWRREARTLLAFERRAARRFDRAVFVSAAEAARFAELAPEAGARLGWFDNGVDLDRFSPALRFENPFPADGFDIAFTGTMDYRPNMDAVIWFAREVLPGLCRLLPRARFSIVGANPAPSVAALAALPRVRVTGRVADVRPYLAHAAAVVAPLRIARGIQNKVLEAMAMGRPVIASPQAFEGVRAVPGRDLLVADGPEETVARVAEVLRGRHPGLPAAARLAMERGYRWSATLRGLSTLLGGPAEPATAEPALAETGA